MAINQNLNQAGSLRVRKFEHPLSHSRMPSVGAQIVHWPSGKVVAEFVDPRLADLFVMAAREHNGLVQELGQLGELTASDKRLIIELESTIDILRPFQQEIDGMTPDELANYHQIGDMVEKHIQSSLYQGRPITDPLEVVRQPTQGQNTGALAGGQAQQSVQQKQQVSDPLVVENPTN